MAALGTSRVLGELADAQDTRFGGCALADRLRCRSGLLMRPARLLMRSRDDSGADRLAAVGGWR